ncbi:LysR family transcriptional regulator [Paraburkholderia phytofirmans OLGA172]|uniref:LysR family transcriptional regulator n=1 Tax=Paraburkholderia phytofirmans OLGA172 TaxID=1417228 RepID=A0A160FU07_9BURK|nr:LysR family transcriptional regulator [Paraburkholderia phytofirmans]ANB76502.1 LysR family transcriptional regulator [Paraburkholderia phytofirmans OLGA172]
MDKFTALSMFVEVAQTGGFTSAARRLNIATSSVTRAVEALEESLGTVLFNRTTRQVALSDAGATYYARAKRIIEDMAEADASVSDRGVNPSGPLRVSVPAAFGRQCIVPHISSFLASHPRLELDIILNDGISDLLTDRIDLAVRLGDPPPSADVVSRTIGHFERYVVASKDYLEMHGIPETPEALSTHQCLRFSYGSDQQVWTFCQGGNVTKIAVTGRLKTNNSEVLREVALNGAGIALLPSWLIDSDVQAGRLTKLFEQYEINPNDARSSITALYMPNHRGSRRIGAFLEFLSDIVS